MSLARFEEPITDDAGNVLPGATVQFRRESDGVLAPVFTDRSGLTPGSNPVVADAYGIAACHLAGGAYRITIAHAATGYTKTYRYRGIGTASEYDIDALLAGQRPGVRAATTANITIATALNNGDTLDGVTLATDDLVLVKDQTDASENGIYVVDAVPARSTDFDTFDEHVGSLVAVSEGTVNEGSYWVCNASLGGTLDSTAIPYTKIVLGVGEDGEPGSSDVVGTSTTSLEIEIAPKIFTIVESDRGWGAGARLRASSDADPTDFMEGLVSSYATNTLELDVDLIGGSGTLDDWTINLAGEPGEDGENGTNGSNGAAGADGESFTWLGAYNGGTAYVENDVVSDQSSSWIALQATTGNAPPTLPTTSNAYWELMASKGADGAGTVAGVTAGTGIDVDNTDPANPIVSVEAALAALNSAFTPASGSSAAALAFAEDTDNGSHLVTLKAPAAVAANVDVMLPGVAGTLAQIDVENQALTGGATVTSKSLGTQTTGTLTLDMGDRPLQHYTNGGAHTLAPGSVNGACLVDITNDGSAGAITTSGWTKVAGDSFTTTNGHKFRCHASVGNGGSLLIVQALQ